MPSQSTNRGQIFSTNDMIDDAFCEVNSICKIADRASSSQIPSDYIFSPDSLPDLTDQNVKDRITHAENFSWEKFLSDKASWRAINGHLFSHERFLEHTFAEHIFRSGR